MIHWTTEYNGFGYHKTECGVKVTTKEVELQKFEGVFRFRGKALTAVESGKNLECPGNYCPACWSKAIQTARGKR